MKDFKEFTGYDWYKFILEDANNNVKICDKYKGWELFNKYNWVDLLGKQSQFADKCDKYDGWKLFGGRNWTILLQKHPQFADKCNKYKGWKLLNGYGWSNLLQKHPQFADKCDEYDGWKLFNGYNWSQLLQRQPQFCYKCYEYKGFSQFNKIYKRDWEELIKNKKTNFIFLIYNFKEYENNINKSYHYLLDIHNNLFKDIETFKKYTDEYITTPEIFKLFIEQGIKDNRVNKIIDFEKIKDFIEGFENLNMLMVKNILDGAIENYKNKKERRNKR